VARVLSDLEERSEVTSIGPQLVSKQAKFNKHKHWTYKGLYQPLIYAQHKDKRKQMIQTESLQCHKLRQINLTKQSSKVIIRRRLNHEIR